MNLLIDLGLMAARRAPILGTALERLGIVPSEAEISLARRLADLPAEAVSEVLAEIVADAAEVIVMAELARAAAEGKWPR